MRNGVQLCLAANNILHMRKGNRAFSPSCDCSCVKKADGFASRGYSTKKQTRWSNEKTIIEFGYRKISWFVSVSQINYLPQPSGSANNWSARHWWYFAQPRPIIANYYVQLFLKKSGSLKVSGKLTIYPSLKLILTLTSHFGQNVGLGKGWEGSFPET